MSVYSALSAIRTWHLHDGNGVIIPNTQGDFQFARASDVLSKRTNLQARAALRTLRDKIFEPTEEILQIAKQTILSGNPNLSEDTYAAYNALKNEYQRVLDEALTKIDANLSVIERYSQKITGRSGALQFMRRLKEANPVDFFFTEEDRLEIDRIYPAIVARYLKENEARLKGDKKNFTIDDTLKLNQLVREALEGKVYRLPPDTKVANRIIDEAKDDVDAGVLYEAQLAQRIYPMLDRLKNVLSKDNPLYLVELGNNCAQNNIQTYLIWKVVNRWFKERSIDSTGILMPIQLTSFGGHPQTATFDAHIEVEESEPICRRAQELIENAENRALIFEALQKSIGKLSADGKEQAWKIFNNDSLTAKEKLEALLQNDATRPIFRLTVGLFSRILPLDYDPKSMSRDQMYDALKNRALYFFRGEGESPTHTALMHQCGSVNIPIQTEDVSTNTGENLALLEMKGKPVIIPIDFCPVGRQVVTTTHQVKAWSAVFSSLIDLPMEYYSGKLTDHQLFVETASYFAELARNILYRTKDSFVSAFPIDDANYQLLWDYYAALKGFTPEEAEKRRKTTSVAEIFDTVKNGFVQFESTIPHGPVMKRNDPQLAEKMQKRLTDYSSQMRAGGILRNKEEPPVDAVGGPRVQIKKLPTWFKNRVVRAHRKEKFWSKVAQIVPTAAAVVAGLSFIQRQ